MNLTVRGNVLVASDYIMPKYHSEAVVLYGGREDSKDLA